MFLLADCFPYRLCVRDGNPKGRDNTALPCWLGAQHDSPSRRERPPYCGNIGINGVYQMTTYQTTEAYAYFIGFNAAQLGKLNTSNPYPRGTGCFHAFNHGHQDGKTRLNIERLNLTEQAQGMPTLNTCN